MPELPTISAYPWGIGFRLGRLARFSSVLRANLGRLTSHMAMGSADKAEARRAILSLLEQRDAGKTICPSDAARALGGDDGFRSLMDLVRAAAGELVEEGRIEVTQHGKPVELDRARGPVRLRAVPGATNRPQTRSRSPR